CGVLEVRLKRSKPFLRRVAVAANRLGLWLRRRLGCLGRLLWPQPINARRNAEKAPLLMKTKDAAFDCVPAHSPAQTSDDLRNGLVALGIDHVIHDKL